MADKNKRLVLLEKCKLTIKEETIPETPSNGLVVKVAYTGICHSDVHIYLQPLVPLPRVLGHEISGTIHDIGTSISKDLQRGDRVVVYPWGHCNKCDMCLNGRSNCKNLYPPTGKVEIFQYGTVKDGGYQQYVVLHDASFVIKVPDDIPLDIACMVPCSGITAHNAVTKLKQSVEDALLIRDHARVAVIGAGGLALWAIPIIKSMYPPTVKITAIDIVKDKLDDAKAQGADDVFQWGKDDAEDVRSQYIETFGEEEFIDGAIDFTGVAGVQLKAFSILNTGGTLALVGLGGPMSAGFPMLGIAFKSIMVKGVMVGSRAEVVQVFKLLLDKKVKPPPVTSVSLDQVEDVLNKLHTGKMRGRAVCSI